MHIEDWRFGRWMTDEQKARLAHVCAMHLQTSTRYQLVAAFLSWYAPARTFAARTSLGYGIVPLT